MPNHKVNTATSVSIGTAPVDPYVHTRASRARKVRNTRPGKRVAVSKVHLCHCLPLNVLYNLALVNPAKHPINTNNKSIPIIMEPLLAGERNPAAEKAIRNRVQIINWIPDPTQIQNTIG